MTRLLLYPLYVVQVFWMSKSFRHNPVIGSVWLNRWGLHKARVQFAHAITSVRWRLLAVLVPVMEREQFDSQGFLVIENFLPEDDFTTLKAELSHAGGDIRRMVEGNTATVRLFLSGRDLKNLPACRRLLANKRYRNLLWYCGGRLRKPMHFVQRIRNGALDGHVDPQKNLHSDTFHPTMKSWLFMDDVDGERGPFTYVPTSHRLTNARLAWEHEQALRGSRLADPVSALGSLRIRREDLARLGLPAPVEMKVPANTLVIANTHGFHCRGPAKPGMTRLEIYASHRDNPFNPFPGLGPLSVAGFVEHAFAKPYWRFNDHVAAVTRRRATWHRVDASELRDDIVDQNVKRL